MSWFDEQLRLRRKKDDENFAAAIDSIADAVMGTRLRQALDSRALAQSAAEEILRYYRCDTKKDTPAPPELSPEEQLEYRMRPHGIMYRTVRLDSGWYRHAVGAMLGTLKDSGAAVALIPGRISGYSWTELETGRIVRLSRKTERLLDTQALCFYKPLPQKALTVADLLKFTAAQLSAADIALYLGLMALAALLGLLSPYFTRLLFGDVLQSGSTRVLLALAGFMISFSVCRICFAAFQTLVNSKVAVKQSIAVQAAVMNRVMSLPAGFFRGHASGELAQRAAYVQTLCSTIFNTVGTTGIASLFSLIYIFQVFAYAPALVVPSLVITLATAALSLTATFAQMKISRERMELSAQTGGLTYATITGIRKIKLAGAEKRMFSRWAEHYSKQLALEYNPPAFLKLSGTLSLAVSLAGGMVLYALAVRSGVSTADYYAFNAAYGMVASAFAAFASVAASVAEIKPVLEMARPIMEAEPEAAGDKEIITALRGEIELCNVSFRYDEAMPDVISDLSLKIKPGEYVAVVGATGCGKSTLLRLLLGFEKPQKGSIYYDRRDISRVDLKSLRRRIGVVMQDGKLFFGDIFSNIVISAPHLGLDAAWEAAEIAAVADDIRSMPMGMHTVISEGQGGISGGQRQRLMIARAVAPKPAVLMFDEATSALDNLTQKKVSDAIDSLNCTRIVIAHRLSTIRSADRIVFLQDGKIAEEGTYDELIARNGCFAGLVARQRLDIDAD